jgi:hypothetical protein
LFEAFLFGRAHDGPRLVVGRPIIGPRQGPAPTD